MWLRMQRKWTSFLFFLRSCGFDVDVDLVATPLNANIYAVDEVYVESKCNEKNRLRCNNNEETFAIEVYGNNEMKRNDSTAQWNHRFKSLKSFWATTQ